MYIAITPLTFIGAGFLVTIATKRFDFLVGRKVRYLLTPVISVSFLKPIATNSTQASDRHWSQNEGPIVCMQSWLHV